MQIKYFLDWYINDKNASAYLSGLKYISMRSSILSLYPIATMLVYLPSDLLENGDISLGSKFDFLFFRSEFEDMKKRTYKVWKINQISQDSARSLSGMYTITLVHPWYFSQEEKTKIYYGSSFLTTAQILLEENKKDFTTYYLDECKDLITKYFRVNQTQGNFLENNLLSKYWIDETPTFMYVNNNSEFHAHSFKRMINSDIGNLAVDTRKIAINQNTLSISQNLDRVLYPLNIAYSLNETGNIWNKFSSTSSLLYKNHSVKDRAGLTSEDSSYFSKGYFPITSELKNMKGSLSTYVDDSEDDLSAIYCSFIQKQKDIITDQRMTFTGPGNFTIQPGESLRLYLKKFETDSQSTEDSIFDSRYVILSMEDNYRDAMLTTSTTIIRDAVQPSTKTLPSTSSGFLT